MYRLYSGWLFNTMKTTFLFQFCFPTSLPQITSLQEAVFVSMLQGVPINMGIQLRIQYRLFE